jgi:hypothetical protein
MLNLLEERESKRLLRSFYEHLLESHLILGAHIEPLGLVEVVHHPTSSLPELNYATPRRKTAWISAKDVEVGLSYLRTIHRIARVQYIEGLFPALFATPLKELGLQIDQRAPILVQRFIDPLHTLPLPSGYTLERGTGELWWDVWRSQAYHLYTLAVEPLSLGGNDPNQIDLVLRYEGVAIGIARVSQQTQTAHLAAIAIQTEHSAALDGLYARALQTALSDKVEMVFAPHTEAGRKMGLVQVGTMVCYADLSDVKRERSYDNTHMAQFVLTLR